MHVNEDQANRKPIQSHARKENVTLSKSSNWKLMGHGQFLQNKILFRNSMEAILC